MTKQEAEALFLLAGIKLKGLFKIENEYYPDNGCFVEQKAADPWWLAITEASDPIKIGWRKRVINIGWEATTLRIDPTDKCNQQFEFHKSPITRDDVTQGPTNVHAYGYGRAVDYLRELKLRLEQNRYAESEEGKVDLAKRKADWEQEQAKEAA